MAQSFLEGLGKFGPVLALLLQAAVISRFLDRRNRDYPLAILFLVGLFLLTLVGAALGFYPQLITRSSNPTDFLRNYSFADLAMHILLLGLMLQLLRKSLLSLQMETRIVFLLALVSVAVAVCAFYFFGADIKTSILLKTRQTVSAWMALLNLYWWTLLLRRRQLDRRILLLSAGIGLMMAGQVISDGVSTFYRDETAVKILGALVMYFTHFAALYTWFNAFSTSNALAPKPALT